MRADTGVRDAASCGSGLAVNVVGQLSDGGINDRCSSGGCRRTPRPAGSGGASGVRPGLRSRRRGHLLPVPVCARGFIRASRTRPTGWTGSRRGALLAIQVQGRSGRARRQVVDEEQERPVPAVPMPCQRRPAERPVLADVQARSAGRPWPSCGSCPALASARPAPGGLKTAPPPPPQHRQRVGIQRRDGTHRSLAA